MQRVQTLGPLVWHGPFRRATCPFAVVFLVAFQEFELPSLLHRPSWTVWVFDSQVGGEQWSRLAGACAVPVLIQLGVACLAAWSVGGTPRSRRPVSTTHYTTIRSVDAAACIGLLTLSAIGLLLGPLWRLRPGLASAVVQLVSDGPRILGWLREIGTSLGVSAAGCGLTFFIVLHWSRQTKPGSLRALTRVVVAVGAAVGLCGSLPIALAVGSICRSVLPAQITHSLLPWFFGVVLLTFPRVLVLGWVWQQWFTPDAVSGMLRESPCRDVRLRQTDIAWLNGGATRWLSGAAVVLLVSFDLTLASILAPAGVVSAPTRLYNLMHYGRTTLLTAMTVVAVVVPGVVLLAGLWGRRMVIRWLIP